MNNRELEKKKTIIKLFADYHFDFTGWTVWQVAAFVDTFTEEQMEFFKDYFVPERKEENDNE